MTEEILNYDKLIYSIINKYTLYYDKEDLYQVGMLGLINAYKHFDTSKNTKFSTYAYTYILGEVVKYVKESSPIKVSSDLQRLNKTIEKARDILRQKLQREPTNMELSLLLDMDIEKIEEVEESKLVFKSLDEDDLLYNQIISEDRSVLAEVLDLKAAIEDLPYEEKTIIIDRYFNNLTQREVSKKAGISQVQVSRKETKILNKLKTRL